jgi:chaperonin GroES
LAVELLDCQIFDPPDGDGRRFSGETMKFRPLNDRVLVKRTETETKTAGGLYIPENAKEKPQEGVIVAAGEGKHLENGKLKKLDVKVGDRVFFRKYAGNELTLEGVEHVVLREDEILAVFE